MYKAMCLMLVIEIKALTFYQGDKAHTHTRQNTVFGEDSTDKRRK